MTDFKEYIANQIVGKKLKFKCDCLLKINIIGTVMGVTMSDDEFIYQVQDNKGKMITIGSNHPDMKVSEISEI